MAFLTVVPREGDSGSWILTLHADDAHPSKVPAGLHAESWADDVLRLSEHYNAKIADADKAMQQMADAGVGPQTS